MALCTIDSLRHQGITTANLLAVQVQRPQITLERLADVIGAVVGVRGYKAGAGADAVALPLEYRAVCAHQSASG